MTKEKNNDRRNFLKLSGGALVAAGSAGLFEASAQHHQKASFRGSGSDPLGNVNVSFAGWMTDFVPPIDRFTAPLPPPAANHHELIPYIARVRAGGYVNFIISGLHVVAVYDNGVGPGDIDTRILSPLGTGLPPVISDPARRLYRGPNPVVSPGPPPVINLDRVEVVHFDKPGTFLVICAVLPHFNAGQYGYVQVVGNGEGDGPPIFSPQK